jgi:membrane protein YqaA with SNARE-associated domain
MLVFATGYLGLFAGSFLASTLLPFPSEALLIACLGFLDPWWCLVIATVGNFMGGMTNYYIGYKCNNETLIRKFKFSEQKILKWQNRLSKFGIWLGLISWVPFIGDPMLVLLGFFRVRFVPLALTVLAGKFLRYLILVLIYLGLIGE